jgi:outer membrane protein TolC
MTPVPAWRGLPFSPLFLLLAGLLAAAPAAAAGVREGFQGALALSPELRALEAEREVVTARRAQAEALLPGAPILGLGYRSDAATQNRGFREYEGSLGLPVWLPGAAAALRGSAEAQGLRLTARQARQRLLLAGEVRDAYWAWALAATERDAARARLAAAQALERDLARQVGAGNAPRADLLLAQADARDAQLTLRDREAAVREAALAFRSLTGAEPTPQGGEPDRSAAAPQGEDPRLLAARAAAAAGRADANLARVRDRPDPELGLQVRQERGSFDEPYGTRIQLGVRIPFAHAPAVRERVALAQADITAAEAEAAQLDRVLALARDRARLRLEVARDLARGAEARHAVLAERGGLVERAYRGGELPLVELVRARAALADADAARRRAAVEAGRAVSQLNQVSGVEP